jgi:hypothetical protein
MARLGRQRLAWRPLAVVRHVRERATPATARAAMLRPAVEPSLVRLRGVFGKLRLLALVGADESRQILHGTKVGLDRAATTAALSTVRSAGAFASTANLSTRVLRLACRRSSSATPSLEIGAAARHCKPPQDYGAAGKAALVSAAGVTRRPPRARRLVASRRLPRAIAGP